MAKEQELSETEIAQKLGVNLATIYRDIEHLKQVANDFVYSLAKKDIAYFYKDAIDDIKKARSKAWSIYNNCKDQQRQLNTLKVVITSNESMFNLLQQGPTVMSLRSMEERLSTIEQGSNSNSNSKEQVTTNWRKYSIAS